MFSKSLRKVEEGPRWQNVELRDDLDGDALRAGPRDFTTLGSGAIVLQLTRLGLVDEYSFVVNPVVLGDGKNAFTGVDRADLELAGARSRRSRSVWT